MTSSYVSSLSTAATKVTDGMRRARVSLFIVFFAQGLGFGSLFARLPAVKDRFELTDTTLSLLTLALPERREIPAGSGLASPWTRAHG